MHMMRGIANPGLAAVTKIHKVCRYDQQHGNKKKKIFPACKELFEDKENKAGCKYEDWNCIAVMPYITMVKGIGPYQACQGDHAPFKIGIMDDVDTKDGKCTRDQGQHGAMNGAAYRGGDTKKIPVRF